MDHSGFEIGNEELPIPPIIGDISESGAGIAAPVQSHFDEKFRDIAGFGRQPVYRSGPAVRSPHSSHPVLCSRRQVQAEGGGGGYENVWGGRVIERDAEDLACIGRGRRRPLRLIDNVLSPWRLAQVAQVYDASDHPVEIDHRDRSVGSLLLNGSRKTGVVSLARLQRRTAGGRRGSRLLRGGVRWGRHLAVVRRRRGRLSRFRWWRRRHVIGRRWRYILRR